MRTQSRGGITLRYPDALAYAFNRVILSCYGGTLAGIRVTIGEELAVLNISAFNNACAVDIAKSVQAAFDVDDLVLPNYKSNMAKAIDITVEALSSSGATLQTFNFNTFFLWGAQKIGGEPINCYPRVKWFANFPFTLPLYCTAGMSVLFGAGSLVNIQDEGVYNFDPSFLPDEGDIIAVYNYKGNIELATFDNTFDLSFYMEEDAARELICIIDVNHCATEGIYLRWVDRHGMIRYYLFEKGDKSVKVANGVEYFRDNIEHYNALTGYSGADGYHIAHTREDLIAAAAPLVDEGTAEMLQDLTTAPVVDMLVNNTWVQVNIQSATYARNHKDELQDFAVVVQLPEVIIQTL